LGKIKILRLLTDPNSHNVIVRDTAVIYTLVQEHYMNKVSQESFGIADSLSAGGVSY